MSRTSTSTATASSASTAGTPASTRPTPPTTATHWDFHAWDLGMGGAQIGPPWFVRRSASLIRNSATLLPAAHRGAATSSTGNYVVFPTKDLHAQTRAGHRLDRPARRPFLVGDRPATSGTGSAGTDTTGPEECLKYAQYIIDNYAQPQLRLSQVTIRPVHPDDPRAADDLGRALQRRHLRPGERRHEPSRAAAASPRRSSSRASPNGGSRSSSTSTPATRTSR